MPKCLGWQAACRNFGADLSWHGQCPKLIVGYLYVPEAWVASESAGRRLNEERYSSPALELNTHGSHQVPYLLPAMPGDGLPLAVQVVPHGVAPATRFISTVSFSAQHRSLRLPAIAGLSTMTRPDGGRPEAGVGLQRVGTAAQRVSGPALGGIDCHTAVGRFRRLAPRASVAMSPRLRAPDARLEP